MTYLAIAAELVGGVVSAIGAMSQASATASADNFQANVASQNAVAAIQQADQDAELLRRKAQQTIGAETAAYGASGVDLAGSPLDVLGSSAASATLDAQTAEYKGGLKSAGFADTAVLDRMGARNAETAGTFSAVSALVGGASGAASAYGQSLKTQ